MEGERHGDDPLTSVDRVRRPLEQGGGHHARTVDEDTDEEKSYQIVGEPEADIDSGKLNIRSPLARALIGKETGDSVEVNTPGGGRAYEVLSVKYV